MTVVKNECQNLNEQSLIQYFLRIRNGLKDGCWVELNDCITKSQNLVSPYCGKYKEGKKQEDGIQQSNQYLISLMNLERFLELLVIQLMEENMI